MGGVPAASASIAATPKFLEAEGKQTNQPRGLSTFHHPQENRAIDNSLRSLHEPVVALNFGDNLPPAPAICSRQ